MQNSNTHKKLVLQLASTLVKQDHLQTWYETEILEGLGKTAQELVDEGRHDIVIKHLERRSHGGYA